MDAATLLEQLPDAAIGADREGVIRYWNAAAVALFGFTAAEAIGQSLDIIIPEYLRAPHWRGYHQALAAGKTKYSGKPLTTRAVSRDGGKVYVAMLFGVLHEPDGSVWGAVATAVPTERPEH